jgi:hypothetical protein
VGLKKTRGCGKPVQYRGGAWSREVQGRGRGERVSVMEGPHASTDWNFPVRLRIGVPTTAGT